MTKSATAARKRAAPRKAAASTPMAGRKTAADKQREGMHVVEAPAPKPAKVTKKQLLAQDVADLTASTPDEIVSVEHVIVDYDVLRQRATESMGEFASQVKGAVAIEASMKSRKLTAGSVVLRVHPLDVHVPQGADRINPRDFSEREMIERVAEYTGSVAVGGVREPLKVFVQGDKLMVLGGETRWRATMHAWMLKAQGVVSNAPTTIPVLLEKSGKNNAVRLLDVVVDNDTKTFKAIQVALNYRASRDLGLSEQEIATYVGKTLTHVVSTIALLEMPQEVLNLVRDGVIRITQAKKVWEAEDRDTAKTLARIKRAHKAALAAGANRAMPKYDTEGGDAEAPATPTTSGGRKTTVDVEVLRRNSDRVNTYIANGPKKVVDGMVWVGIPVEDFAGVVAPLTGSDIPELAKDAA